jgi:hypothetical protein
MCFLKILVEKDNLFLKISTKLKVIQFMLKLPEYYGS